MARLATAVSFSVLGLALGCDAAPSANAVQTGSGGAAGAGGAVAEGGASNVPSAGAGGTAAHGCSDVDPELAEADAAELFAYPRVPTFDLRLPRQQWEQLQANAAKEQYAEAEACFEGRGIGRIGLRFKGSYGSLFECAGKVGEGDCRKLSMKLKFNEYDAERRFFGLKRLNLNANRFDDSRIKERLAYDLFRAMDIVAPRAAWAVVRVNDESLGLFGMVEEVDGRFTADRWPSVPDNNLYKELWPTNTDPAFIGTRLQTNEDAPDVSNFVAFATALASADANEVRSTLGSYMDLSAFARFLAVEDAIASYDGITYFWTDGTAVGNHNFYIYEEAPDRFTLIPWDVEATFWLNPDHAAPHWTEPISDCTQTYPYWGGLARAPGCDRVIQAVAADLQSWRAAGQALLDGPFAEATMLANIDRHAAFVSAEARADPTPSSYGDFDSAVADLRSVVPALRERLKQLLAKEPAP
jgi:hypothetical protein